MRISDNFVHDHCTYFLPYDFCIHVRWTTWDVGAVDPERVVAIIPIVLDAINFVEVEHHQWRSYGGWSWALVDYYEMNLMERFDDPNMVKLQEQVGSS